LKNLILAIATVLVPAISASAQTDPDVIWRGGFENGTASLTGNCTAGQDEWCATQTIRAQQIQIVPDPVAQGKTAARFEVKFGDAYSYYSDARTLITGPDTLWENEGDEKWYRWQALWPQDWVGSYPKWDELSNPSARSSAGSIVEWHHDANGGVESGSAPIYIGANDADISICIVDQTTSSCRENLTLAKLQRSHWHDFILHAKWSSNPSIGYLEIWIDGVNVLPKHFGSNKYPSMRNYLVVGLYRNGHIGDPSLLWPDGTHVYGSNGTPGVVYLDGFIVGKTMASVLAERQWGDAPPPDAGTPPADPGATPDAGTATPPPDQKLSSVAAPGGGCTSTGAQLAWIALPLLALLALRRRRPCKATSTSGKR